MIWLNLDEYSILFSLGHICCVLTEPARSSKMKRNAEFWWGCGTNGKAYSDDKPETQGRFVMMAVYMETQI